MREVGWYYVIKEEKSVVGTRRDYCISVYYERHDRIADESHYSFCKMFALAFDGITGLSFKLIRMIIGFDLNHDNIEFRWSDMVSHSIFDG